MELLLLPRAPGPNEPLDPLRTRKFIDIATGILNGLIRDGTLVLDGPGEWSIPEVLLGQPGAPGAIGPPGATGQANQWLVGSGEPTSSLGREADLYLDVQMKTVWTKRSLFFGYPPSWFQITSLAGGPRGAEGERGAQGERGEPGPAGPGSNPAGGEAVTTAVQEIATATTTAITFHEAVTDAGVVWSTTRLTCQRAGWAIATAHVKWESNTVGKEVLDLRYNGTIFRGSVSVGPAAGHEDPDLATSYARHMSVGDYVEATVFQNSGGGLDVTAAQLSLVFV